MQDPRLTWLFAFACPTALVLAVFYTLLLALTILAGAGLWEAHALFLDASLFALGSMLEIAIGSWILFAYLYSVSVPPAHEIDRGRLRALVGFHAFKIRLLDIRLVARLIAACLALSTSLIAAVGGGLLDSVLDKNSPLRPAARRELPKPLAVGWTPSIHPQIVYH